MGFYINPILEQIAEFFDLDIISSRINWLQQRPFCTIALQSRIYTAQVTVETTQLSIFLHKQTHKESWLHILLTSAKRPDLARYRSNNTAVSPHNLSAAAYPAVISKSVS